MIFFMLIWLVRWYNIQFPILRDHTEVEGGARANSEKGWVDRGCSSGLSKVGRVGGVVGMLGV